MTVLVEPFASVYDDGGRIGVILARGRRGFEAYAADDYSLGLFPSPRKSRRRDHHDAPVGRPNGRRKQARAEPTVTSLGIDHGKADDKTWRTRPCDFVLRRDRH